MKRVTTLLLLLAAALWLLAGCGSSNTTATNTPPTTTPPTSTPPTGNPPPTNPPPALTSQQYEAALLRPTNMGEVAGGQIIVNAGGISGAGMVTATNGAKSATYTITFQPFGNPFNSSFQVGTVMSDAAGNINGSFTFPKKGTFSGIFHLSAGTNSFNTEIDPMDSGVDDNTNFAFNVPMVQAGQVSPPIPAAVLGGTQTITFGPDPLASGLATANQGNWHLELHGAAPNTTYTILQCDNQTGCADGGPVTTDATGTVSSDQSYFISNRWDPRAVFGLLRGGNDLVYVTGFVVK